LLFALFLFAAKTSDARLQILKKNGGTGEVFKGVDLEHWAEETDGFSGAELASLLQKATLNAMREAMGTSAAAVKPKVMDKHVQEVFNTHMQSRTEKPVKLNIGGTIVQINEKTLDSLFDSGNLKQTDSNTGESFLLKRQPIMAQRLKKDSNGALFLDRNIDSFMLLLDAVRGCDISVHLRDPNNAQAFCDEVKWFMMGDAPEAAQPVTNPNIVGWWELARSSINADPKSMSM
jgi:hypothetical protein